MTDARIIDGKAMAARISADLAMEVESLRRDRRLRPGLAVVLVGDDPASAVYVRNKQRKAEALGLYSVIHELPADTSQQAVLALIERLNADEAVHGILVQLPLPAQLDERTITQAVDPAKDVDGFHFINVGMLGAGHADEALVPCTPAGCMRMIGECCGSDLSGLDAVVVGRSNIVGKPMANLLLQANATVTVGHSRTRELPLVCRRADILVVAAGRANLVKGDWIKPGAVVIDVGINRVEVEPGKTRLTGDVDFDSARSVAAAITPVPGGVGPMTIAMLMANTLKAARRSSPI